LLPLDTAWTTAFPFGGAIDLVMGDSRLFTVQDGHVAAQSLAEGTALWESPLTTTALPVVVDGHVYLVGEDRLESLSETSGFVEWRLDTGPVTLTPTARAGWVLVTNTSGRLQAVSASDGRLIWEAQLPAALAAPLVIDGDIVAAALQDGRVIAWTVTTGAERWTRPLGTRVQQLLAAHGRVYVTGDNQALTALRLRDGHQEWAYPIDMPVVGRLAVDADHIYVATIDNSVRIHGLNGHQKRRVTLASRVVDGLVADGARVFVPQSNGEIRVFLSDGTRAGRLAPAADGAVLQGALASSGRDETFRLAVTLAEASQLTVTTYVRTSLPITSAISGAGTPIPLTPPSVRLPWP
ncbi:MAG: PQQ-binding-like beta-propeller repeat protein, partial [Caldilineaceae bacterium]|nr:PQQ-binding-like beta-propeller repeat protein [Caldilineaceae bacterium]